MISAAQLLDELMGRDRNLAPDEKRSNVRWDHESVSPAGLGPVPGRHGGGERRGWGSPGPRQGLGPGRPGVKCLTPWLEGIGRIVQEGGVCLDPWLRDDLLLFKYQGSKKKKDLAKLKSSLMRQGNAGKEGVFLYSERFRSFHLAVK